MKIGLLGGSFDPVHKGHLLIANKAIEVLNLDYFYFIPTKNNPWKDGSDADIKDRLAMLEIAINGNEKMGIERYECDLPGDEKNYTYKTLEALKEKYPYDELYYLMGMDQVVSFDAWKHPKRIANSVQLVAFNRGGYIQETDNLEKYHFIKIDNEEITASSTDIKKGDLTPLDDDVLRYISSHGLYLDQMIASRMKEKRYRHSLSVAKLCKEFALGNGVDPLKAYIAGVMHDVAKELPRDQAVEIMQTHYSKYMGMAYPIWHQWTGSYVCKHEFLIDDEDILKAIEDHTTGSTNMTKLGKCLYCADKLDPLRGYDSSKQIALCKKDIDEGFKRELINFYEFSKSKNRSIDPVFNDIYDKYVKGN